jgi:preprotein translocase subunit YajC
VPALVQLVPFIGIALLFWFLLIRPASKRQKELVRMQSSLKAGDEVVLTSGIFGVLRDIEEERLHVEIADGVTIKVARAAVGAIAQPGLASDEPEEN